MPLQKIIIDHPSIVAVTLATTLYYLHNYLGNRKTNKLDTITIFKIKMLDSHPKYNI